MESYYLTCPLATIYSLLPQHKATISFLLPHYNSQSVIERILRNPVNDSIMKWHVPWTFYRPITNLQDSVSSVISLLGSCCHICYSLSKVPVLISPIVAIISQLFRKTSKITAKGLSLVTNSLKCARGLSSGLYLKTKQLRLNRGFWMSIIK